MPSFEPTTVIVWLLLLGIPLLLLLYMERVRKRADHGLRPIAAFDVLRGLLGRATEEGKRVHLSLGRSGVGGDQTAVVSAGLQVLRHLADEGAAMNVAPVLTVADPLLMLTAQDTLYRAYQAQDRAADFESTDVQYIAPDPLVYAVGAQDTINDEQTAANVMVGHLGDEYLMMGEAGAQREIPQLAGSDVLSTQAFMPATTDHVLVGEEMFAAGAYLREDTAQIASLHVQDVLRILAAIAIVVGVLIKSLT